MPIYLNGEPSVRYRAIHTSKALLISYELLALSHKRSKSAKLNIESGQVIEADTKDYGNYNQSLALLSTNAAIIEGALRGVLLEALSNEIEETTKLEISKGFTEPSNAQRLMIRFQREIESQGGWVKLKEQLETYFRIKIDKVLTKDTKLAIDTLFTLRNIIAHGTAIVQPVGKVPDSSHEETLRSWERRLQSTRDYLKANFSHDHVFDNLAEHDVPEHFIEITKTLFKEVSDHIKFPERAMVVIEMVNGYSFGYIHYSH